MWRKVLWQGLVSGAVGVSVMTAAEKLEQRLTGRPDSHVPARVLERLTGLPEQPGAQPRAVNLAMHYGQGVALGVLRSLMAHVGLRGPLASAKFTVVRLTNDQILENATGVGAPPQTWPRGELAVDLLHKLVYDRARRGRARGEGRPRSRSAACSGGSGPALRRRTASPLRGDHRLTGRRNSFATCGSRLPRRVSRSQPFGSESLTTRCHAE
jgi:hypothetical protein